MHISKVYALDKGLTYPSSVLRDEIRRVSEFVIHRFGLLERRDRLFHSSQQNTRHRGSRHTSAVFPMTRMGYASVLLKGPWKRSLDRAGQAWQFMY